MGGEFDSAWLKYGWAIRHGQELCKANDEFIAAGPMFREVVTFDAASSELVLSAADVVQPPATMALHLADALGCFRQCLDHVAWVMVQRGSASNKDQKNTHFVLADHRNAFGNAVAKTMTGITDDDCALVKQFNADHLWAASPVEHTPVYVMRALNNADKHEALKFVLPAPNNLRGRVSFSDCKPTDKLRPAGEGPLVNGRELARVPVTGVGANPSMTPIGTLSTVPTIDGFVVQDLVNMLIRTIRDGILMPLQPDPPDAIFELGAGIERARES